MVELSRRDTSGPLNLVRIGKALSSQRIAAEEAPPALLQIEPARSCGDEDVMKTRMRFEPGARLQAVVAAQVIGNHVDVASRIIRFNVGQQSDVVLRVT